MAGEETVKWWRDPRVMMAVPAVSLMAASVIRFVQGDTQTGFAAMMCAFVFAMCMGGQQRAPKSSTNR